MFELPKNFFLVKGDAEGYSPLNAFDSALLKSGIGNTNLIKVTSIIPPGSKHIRPKKAYPGSLLPCAYSYKISDIPGEIISACVCVALPEEESAPGVIMEFSSTGRKDLAEEIVKKMAEEAMNIRGLKIKKMFVTSVQHRVRKIGCVFAGVVLWG